MKVLTKREQELTFGGSTEYNNGHKLIYGIAKLYGAIKASTENFFDSFTIEKSDYIPPSNVA
ncbi:MAG: hypothetical protein JJU28_01760 [Cyclobacteriaceae bacterium]|nr:hypothetical protein [Cyclobacteriaceae bacterium]